MKRVGHLTERIADVRNIYLAYAKACKGKQCKREVLRFQVNFDSNISELREQLLSGEIDVGQYHYFTIFDPKQRVICAASFRERVIHHAIMNVCHQYFDRSLIDDTYATRKGKGVYSALDKAKKGIVKYGCVAKLDFRKYYDSIDHGMLKGMLRQKFKDKTLLVMFDRIIDSYEVNPGKGLPIGNLTSQYFANLYLSGYDHLVKECLRVPLYIRYMDDMLLASSDMKSLKDNVSFLKKYASNNLFLTLKPPIFRQADKGVPFLGYRLFPHYYLLAGRSKRRLRTKFLKYYRNLASAQWDEREYEEHILPLFAFSLHASSKHFRQSLVEVTESMAL